MAKKNLFEGFAWRDGDFFINLQAEIQTITQNNNDDEKNAITDPGHWMHDGH